MLGGLLTDLGGIGFLATRFSHGFMLLATEFHFSFRTLLRNRAQLAHRPIKVPLYSSVQLLDLVLKDLCLHFQLLHLFLVLVLKHRFWPLRLGLFRLDAGYHLLLVGLESTLGTLLVLGRLHGIVGLFGHVALLRPLPGVPYRPLFEVDVTEFDDLDFGCLLER